MEEIPAVSVIIPTLNEEKYLPVLLKSLGEIDAPLEIIIVDGGSSDLTHAVARESKKYLADSATLKFISLNEKGISLQRNVGVQHAQNEIILFCDADVVAMKTKEHRYFISEFITHNYVAAAGRIVPSEKSLTNSIAHNTAYAVQRLLFLFGRAYFGGAYLLTRKDIFERVGGFDETLLVSEDVDYSIRVSREGRCKLFNIPIKVSTRRFQKYGYSWILKNPLMVAKLLVRGKLTKKDKVFYPFGEY